MASISFSGVQYASVYAGVERKLEVNIWSWNKLDQVQNCGSSKVKTE